MDQGKQIRSLILKHETHKRIRSQPYRDRLLADLPLAIFLFLLLMLTVSVFPFEGYLWAKTADRVLQQVESDMIETEKKNQMEELFQLGDELLERKNYDRAVEAYEQVFVVDPENVRASAKIDMVKKQMMHEGRDETVVVDQVYEEEIQERLKNYWKQSRLFLKQGKIGQARFTIQKILLLDPLNREAQALYDKLEMHPLETASPADK